MKMSEKKSYLNLYIGTPGDDGSDFLYLDLVIPGREVPLWSSKEELNDCGGDDFLKLLEEALNEASLYVKSLGLQVRIDIETILEMTEDYSERISKEVTKLIQEVRE
jgi:hypothetical protein